MRRRKLSILRTPLGWSGRLADGVGCLDLQIHSYHPLLQKYTAISADVKTCRTVYLFATTRVRNMKQHARVCAVQRVVQYAYLHFGTRGTRRVTHTNT